MRRTIRLLEKQEVLNPKLFKNQKLIPDEDTRGKILKPIKVF